MGREPVLLTRRKDFRFAIVRLLERYQVEAQVLCISELAPKLLWIKLPILNSRGEVMESTEKKEALMRIKATSKNELYRKLFDQYGTDYYYVVDESVKRNIPFLEKGL